jgi:hypothetical protein
VVKVLPQFKNSGVYHIESSGNRITRVYSAVIVAVVTCWFDVEPAVDVALLAIELDVLLTHPHSCDPVPETAGIPVHVTGCASMVEFRDLSPGWMTGPTFEVFVKSIVRPTDLGMGKQRLDFGVMAMNTRVSLVTVIAWLVVFFKGPCGWFHLPYIVTTAAVLFLVTVDAHQVEELDVLLVVKGDDGSFFIPGLIDPRFWFMNDRMVYTDYIGLIPDRRRQSATCLFHVADFTLRVVTPLPVTVHTLSVISPLQAGLSQVSSRGSGIVTFLAGRMGLVRRCVMVTECTAVSDLRHAGVKLVCEDYRYI